MKPNHQSGEYLSLRWDGDPDEVYLYGHVDLPTFLGEVEAYHGGSVDSQDFGTFPVFDGQIRHRWARFLRAGQDDDGNPTTTLHEYPEAGRGRFKVTAMTPTRWVRFERCARTIAGEDGEASCWIRDGHTGPCRPWTDRG